jgi:large subunit ribosomal protein L35
MKIKAKTHSGSKKRFKLTGTGKVKRGHAFASHLLSKKNPKRRRKLRSSAIVECGDMKRLRKLIGN